MADVLLVLNAGSSSLKFSVYEASPPLTPLFRGQVDSLAREPDFRVSDGDGAALQERRLNGGRPLSHADAAAFILSWCRERGGCELVAAGHRVVHGGSSLASPVVITAEVVGKLREIVPLAPLHQPQSLAAIAAVASADPDLPQVACFDTAFHRTQPPVAQVFAIPRKYSDEGVLRYGFHGLSYEYIASALPEVDLRAAVGRTVVAHLGNGASLCAMSRGRSVATTMGLSALDGLVMGTRCGSIDPGVLFYLMERHGLTSGQVQRILYEQSGLLGVSGVSGDMRRLLDSTDPHAREAIELFVYRAARQIASMAGALQGLDALVFTGGIGEHAVAVRADLCRACAWLGVLLDPVANAAGGPRITLPGSPVCAWVIPTNEELVIARHTMRLIERA